MSPHSLWLGANATASRKLRLVLVPVRSSTLREMCTARKVVVVQILAQRKRWAARPVAKPRSNTEAFIATEMGLPANAGSEPLKRFLERWLDDCVKPRCR